MEKGCESDMAAAGGAETPHELPGEMSSGLDFVGEEESARSGKEPEEEVEEPKGDSWREENAEEGEDYLNDRADLLTSSYENWLSSPEVRRAECLCFAQASVYIIPRTLM